MKILFWMVLVSAWLTPRVSDPTEAQPLAVWGVEERGLPAASAGDLAAVWGVECRQAGGVPPVLLAAVWGVERSAGPGLAADTPFRVSTGPGLWGQEFRPPGSGPARSC